MTFRGEGLAAQVPQRVKDKYLSKKVWSISGYACAAVGA